MICFSADWPVSFSTHTGAGPPITNMHSHCLADMPHLYSWITFLHLGGCRNIMSNIVLEFKKQTNHKTKQRVFHLQTLLSLRKVFQQCFSHTCKQTSFIKRLCRGKWEHLILLLFIDPCCPNIKWCTNEQCAAPYSKLPCITFMMCIGYHGNDRTTTFLCRAALNQHVMPSGNNSMLQNNKAYLY